MSAVQPPADRRLELAWRRHRQWSVAAETAKTRLDRWRWCNLVLLVLAAAAGAMAAQPELPTEVATGFAIAAAVLLAVAGLVQANALNKDQAARWTAARAASEALKAEVYRYLLRVAPYDGTRPADVLDSQTDAVQKRTAALLVDQQGAQADGTPLPTLRDTAQYVTDRAQNQADWHRKKIGEHLRRARSLRICQFAATAVGVVLSVLAGFVPGWHLTSWIAALATIAAAFGTQLAATQHQRIAASYAATVDQLERLVAGFEAASAPAQRQAQFVADVERVLAAQNDGWTDLLTTDRTAENPPAPADDAERPVDDAEPPAGAEPLAADAAPTPP